MTSKAKPSWRATALAALDVAQLARWLELMPVLERFAFDPPQENPFLVERDHRQQRQPVATIAELAALMETKDGMDAALAGLDTVMTG